MTERRLLSTSEGATADAFGVTEWLLLAAVATIWGSSFFFIEIALDAFSPYVITWLRIVFGAMALLLVPAARRPIEQADWGRVALLGVVWMAVPLSAFPVAQQWIDSSVAGMLNSSMPLFSALIAAVLLRRMPGTRQMTGLIIGFGGIVLISAPAIQDDSSALGIGLILAATVFYGLAANLVVPLQQRYGALPVLLRVQLVAVVLTATPAVGTISASRFDLAALAAVIALGALGTGVAFVLMATLVGRVGATRGSVTIYFVPVVAIVLGTVLLSEPFLVISFAGTLIVLAGAWLTSRSEARR